MIALLILWTSALLIRLCLWLRHPDWDERTLCDFLYYRTHARFDAFVAGLLLAHVHHRWQAPIARWFQDPRARAAVALTSLTCLWLLAHPWMFGPWAARPMHVLAWGTLTSILYSGWILLLVHGGRGWLERVLSAPVLRSLATLSYGVYLSYVPICAAIVRPGARLLVNGHDWPISLVWPLAVAVLSILSLSAARVLHVLVEKPCLRLRYARH